MLLRTDPGWFVSLSPLGRRRLFRRFDIWRRPEQCIPDHRWNTCGLVAGRGYGKSAAIAHWINARVMAGREKLIALMAPTETRVAEVQIKSLIDYSAPGEAPNMYQGALVWPNGTQAFCFTPLRPGRARGSNFSLAWCTEFVDWDPKNREEAFKNVMLATRVGERRVIYDTTAKGRNELRTLLDSWNALNPCQHVQMHGTMFDNPLYDTAYLQGQWISYTGVRRAEELFGMSFSESEGAAWTQELFDRTRVASLPEGGLDWFCVAVDPAMSTYSTADETGICAGGRGRKDGHAYVTDDQTGKHRPEEWRKIVVDLADPRRAGPGGSRRGRVVIERKHAGELLSSTVKSEAETRGLRTRILARGEPWPPFDPGCVFIREQNTNLTKGTRAEGPAAETDAGRVHLVDPLYPERPAFADLEKECTTYVPDSGMRSPNRLDALVYLVIELRELRLDSPADHAAEARAAAAANAELQRRMAGAAPGAAYALPNAARGLVNGGGRRLGL